jgi:hypothetical protein
VGYSNPILLATSATGGIVLPYRPMPAVNFGVSDTHLEEPFDVAFFENRIAEIAIPSSGTYLVEWHGSLVCDLENSYDTLPELNPEIYFETASPTHYDPQYWPLVSISAPRLDTDVWHTLGSASKIMTLNAPNTVYATLKVNGVGDWTVHVTNSTFTFHKLSDSQP